MSTASLRIAIASDAASTCRSRSSRPSGRSTPAPAAVRTDGLASLRTGGTCRRNRSRVAVAVPCRSSSGRPGSGRFRLRTQRDHDADRGFQHVAEVVRTEVAACRIDGIAVHVETGRYGEFGTPPRRQPRSALRPGRACRRGCRPSDRPGVKRIRNSGIPPRWRWCPAPSGCRDSTYGLRR